MAGSLKIKIFFLLGLFISSFVFSQDYLNEGLFFSSHEVIQDKRTSLNLTPEKPLHFKKKFSLEFEANFREGDGYYGDIFRIIVNKELNIDLISNLKSEEVNFWLVVKDSILFTYKWSDIPNGDFNEWVKFKLEIDTQKSSVSISINGKEMTKNTEAISGLNDFEIVFGKIVYKNFSSSDVCPMSLKNIKIFDDKKALLREWKLGKHTNSNKVFDEIKNDFAMVQNPKWLLDQHIIWKKNEDFHFNNLLGTTQDEQGERIFFIDKDAVYIYSLGNKVMDTLKYDGNLLRCRPNDFIYNSYNKELWAYSIDLNTYNKFDFDTLKWSVDEKECDETDFWHHNKIISPIDSTLITFGGYGFYRYKNTFKKFNKESDNWKDIDNSNNTIEPRYLSSTGVLNKDKFLVFGGYGSKTGRQEVNIQNYYDLYTVDFDGFQINKLWKTDNSSFSQFVPLESMVVDSDSNSFYTLIYDNSKYNTRLKLARFGIDAYDKVVFSDSIPYKFLDVKSKASFFLNQKKSKLYTFTSLDNNVSLFSLTYPPLLSSEVFQKEKVTSLSSKYLWAIIVLCFFALGSFFLIRKSRKRLKKGYDNNDVKNDKFRQILHSESIKRTHSAIFLFGGFQVYDKEGKDITAMFTPTIKQLFLLILLSTSKNEKGITSFKLTELLWYDKTENSARNNRNVNISKLRIILEKIGGVEINNENTYWRLTLGEDVYCDYLYANELISQLAKDSLEGEKVYQLINAVSAGEICPDIQTEWIDSFKVDIANRLIDGLEYFSKKQNDLNLLTLIADAILKYDPLNEEAITLKCSSLYSLGKKGLAKHSYDNFCNEYLSLLGTKYNTAFKNIIE